MSTVTTPAAELPVPLTPEPQRRAFKKPLPSWRQPKPFWSGLILIVVALMAIFAPMLGPDPTVINPDLSLTPPWPFQGASTGHWLGTDDLGRDLFSRLGVGARISLLIGLATAAMSVVIGTLYGVSAALFGGRFDTVMMRFIDILYALPALMLVILFSVFLGRGVTSLVLVLSLFSWPDTARIIRSQILSIQREEFVEAYRSIGGGTARLIWKHFIPNAAGLIVLTATITVPRAILTESTLSFIGLGVEPPLSSWGSLAGEGWQMVRLAPYMLIFPALIIVLTMVALNLLGDALQKDK